MAISAKKSTDIEDPEKKSQKSATDIPDKVTPEHKSCNIHAP
jgi:hypothetical protein